MDVAAADDGIDWEAGRIAYETSPETTLESIAASLGISRRKLSWHAERAGWLMRDGRRSIGRPLIIARMLRVLERQLVDLENGMTELHRNTTRSGEKEVALLGKLAGNLEKLMAIEKLATGGKTDKRQSKDMAALRNKLAKRIEQLRLE